MSSGRKKSNIQIDRQPAIKNITYNLPSGDTVSQRVKDGKLKFSTSLSPSSRKLIDTAKAGMLGLADELKQPDAIRQKSIHERANDFFGRLRTGIHEDASRLMEKTKSDLSKRFGGTYNATFGTDLLGRQHKNYLAQLKDARIQANLLGEDLARADEASRINRFNLFNNVVNGFNNQLTGLVSPGLGFLSGERDRNSRLALAQAQFDQQYQQQRDEQARQNRLNALRLGAQIGGAALGLIPGGQPFGAALAASGSLFR